MLFSMQTGQTEWQNSAENTPKSVATSGLMQLLSRLRYPPSKVHGGSKIGANPNPRVEEVKGIL
jgi:hypothetical protein